jgi:hypothetical protein
MQDGHQIKYLDLDETSNMNPLQIHLRRAEELRFFRNHAPLGIDEVTPLPAGNSDNELAQPRPPPSLQPCPPPLPTQPLKAQVVIRRENSFNFNVKVGDLNNNTEAFREAGHRISEAIISSVPSSGNPGGLLPEDCAQVSVIPEPQVESSSSATIAIPIRNSKRTIFLGDNKVSYMIEDIQWPLGAVSFRNDIPGLIREWEESSRVHLKGIPVPMKYWGQLFRGIQHKSWEVLKKGYSEQKVKFQEFLPLLFLILTNTLASNVSIPNFS